MGKAGSWKRWAFRPQVCWLDFEIIWISSNKLFRSETSIPLCALCLSDFSRLLSVSLYLGGQVMQSLRVPNRISTWSSSAPRKALSRMAREKLHIMDSNSWQGGKSTTLDWIEVSKSSIRDGSWRGRWLNPVAKMQMHSLQNVPFWRAWGCK